MRRPRRLSALALLVAAPLLLAGCHDEERLRQRLEGPPARLPVEPDQPKVPPAPALLDTIGVWVPPKLYPSRVTNLWPVSTLRANGFDLTYRVPDSWRGLEDEDGQSGNRRRTVEAQALLTELDDSDISLATYAAQLADGAPIYQYTTEDGHIVYLMRREVSLAPSDPEAPREVFHTAVVSLDGRIAKLDLRFDADLAWQFDDLASAITGTVQVRRRTS